MLRVGAFRFFFFSREEPRVHVCVQGPDGEAKFWLDPEVSLAENVGLTASALRRIDRLVRQHEGDIREAWRKHFGR